MKKVFSALFAFATLTALSQKDWKNIKGSGNIQKESRTVGTFTAIDSRGSMDVDITYGNSNQVEVEADDNLLPHIVTKVEGDKLVITTDKNGISSSTKLQVHVTMAKITGLTLSGSGNIKAHGEFNNEGTTYVDTRGSGNIKMGFAAISKLAASVHGSGNVELEQGKVDNLNAEVSGSGNINAYAVVSKNVVAATHGSGDVKVTAEESLVGSTNGSGNVYYKGKATNINVKSSGSGKVVKG